MLQIILRELFHRRRLILPIALSTLLYSPGVSFPSNRIQVTNNEYITQSWLSSDGLLENSALSIAQTTDGYLWIGTSSGLVRFNGFEFTQIARTADLKRLSHAVTCLHTDLAGRLWAGTGVGLSVLENGRWRNVEPENVLARTIAEDASGRVFVGTFMGELFSVGTKIQLEAGVSPITLEQISVPDGFTESSVFCWTDLADGKMWVANSGFIGWLGSDGWQRLGPEVPVMGSIVAAPARDGGLWVYTAGRLWQYGKNQTPKSYPAPSLNGLRSIMEDHEGSLWITATPDGVIRRAPDGKWTVFSETNTPAPSSALFVYEDVEQNIWIGSSSEGLRRLRKRQFQSFGPNEGLPDQIVRTVAEEDPDTILVGTDGGGKVHIQEGKVARKQPLTTPRIGAYVWSVLRDRKGRIWTGTYYDGLFIEENGQTRNIPLDSRLDRNVYALFEDSRNAVWVGAEGGLGIVQDDQVKPWTDDKKFAPGAVRSIAEDLRQRVIWIGTYTRGLWCLEQSGYRQISLNDGLPGERISSLYVDGEGWVWAGIFGQGLVCISDGRVAHISTGQGLDSETVGAILEDGLGWIWLGTNRGILRVSREELERVVTGELAQADFTLFDCSDGLPTVECAEGYQPTAIRDSQGHLWFATLQGVVAVNPSTLHLNPFPPPVVLEEVSYVDKSGVRHAYVNPSFSTITLPPGSRDIWIRFVALSYASPEKNQYAYRFGDHTSEWVKLGLNREIRLYTLPPGEQLLEIRAANNDGIWGETGRMLTLIIRPFFWQTWWFGLLALGGLLAGVGFTARQGLQRRLRREIERIEQQSAIERERARLGAVMEATSDLVFFADADGKLLHLNSAGRGMLGFAPEEDLNDISIGELHAAQTRPQLENEYLPRVLKKGLWQGDAVLARRDGAELPVSEVIVAHRDIDGELTHLSGIMRDIFDRKRAENALRESEGRIRSIIKAAPVGIGVVVDGMFVEVNDQLCEIMGYDQEELLEEYLEILLPTPEDRNSGVQEYFEWISKHPASTAEARFKRKDGKIIDVLISYAPVEGEDLSRAATYTVLDITERKRVEEEKKELENQLMQGQKMEALGTLVGGIAHDFNNILGAILGYTELALGDTEKDTKTAKHLRAVLKAGGRAKDLVRQILTFSRRAEQQLKPIQIKPIAKEVLKLIRATLPTTIAIEQDIDSDSVIMADPIQLHQVLMNLCSNAGQAMKDHGGTLTVGLEDMILDESFIDKKIGIFPGPHVKITVRDTGCGIAPEIIEKIFDPYFTTKGVGEGTGLGLSVVHGIVKSYKGAITVQSEPGRGATFIIFLPAQEIDLGTEKVSEIPLPTGKERILLVDDEPAIVEVGVGLLEKLGYQMTASTSSIEALDVFTAKPEKFDLVITDMTMPGMTGEDLAKEILKIRANIPVVLCTGYGNLINKERAAQIGIKGFIMKPYAFRDIALAVREALDASRK